MWEAYKAGGELLTSSPYTEEDITGARKAFSEWLAKKFPEVANAEQPYFDKAAESGKTDYETRDQRTLDSLKAKEVYWHEWGCRASVYTANRTGDCKCDGRMPAEVDAELANKQFAINQDKKRKHNIGMVRKIIAGFKK